MCAVRRKVAAMGGMSAQIPIKDDPRANEVAMEKVRADKYREVTNGHDGTWIAHPLINKIARKVFDDNMLGPNQVRCFHLGKNHRRTDSLFHSIMSAVMTSKLPPPIS